MLVVVEPHMYQTCLEAGLEPKYLHTYAPAEQERWVLGFQWASTKCVCTKSKGLGGPLEPLEGSYNSKGVQLGRDRCERQQT